MVSKYEIKTQKTLEKMGYRVDNKRGMGRWSKNRDFWNLFDLVAVKDGEPLRWISVKGVETSLLAHKKAIEGFYLPHGNSKELWRYPHGIRKEPVIEYFNDEFTGY